jgi:hypothetical protein
MKVACSCTRDTQQGAYAQGSLACLSTSGTSWSGPARTLQARGGVLRKSAVLHQSECLWIRSTVAALLIAIPFIYLLLLIQFDWSSITSILDPAAVKLHLRTMTDVLFCIFSFIL